MTQKKFGKAGEFLGIFLSLFMIAIPLLAQQAENPVLDAEIQATAHVSGIMWIAIGFLCGIFGWGAAYLIVPSPPASAFIGKSPAYVAAYTDAYKRKARSIQTSNALIGCLIWSTISVIISAATYSSDSTY